MKNFQTIYFYNLLIVVNVSFDTKKRHLCIFFLRTIRKNIGIIITKNILTS